MAHFSTFVSSTFLPAEPGKSTKIEIQSRQEWLDTVVQQQKVKIIQILKIDGKSMVYYHPSGRPNEVLKMEQTYFLERFVPLPQVPLPQAKIEIGQIWLDATVPKSSDGVSRDRVKIIAVSDSNIVYVKRYESLSERQDKFEGDLKYPTSIWGVDQTKTMNQDDFRNRFVPDVIS